MPTRRIKYKWVNLIVFYTDGIPEAMNSRGEEFGENNFETLLLSNRNLKASELSDLVFGKVKSLVGKDPELRAYMDLAESQWSVFGSDRTANERDLLINSVLPDFGNGRAQ